MNRYEKVFMFSYAILLFAIYTVGFRIDPLLREYSGALPGWSYDWLWAFEHFRWHNYFAISVIFILMTSLAILILKYTEHYPITRSIIQKLPSLWNKLFASSFFIFWVFRGTAMSGDADRLIRQLEANAALFMSHPFTSLIVWLVYKILPAWRPVSVIALVNCIAGIIYFFAITQFAKQFNNYRWIFSFLMLSLGASMWFFGYIEATSWAITLALLYIYVAHKDLTQKRKPFLSSFLLGISIVLHGSYLYLGLSWMVLIWSQIEQHKWRSVAIAALCLLVLPITMITLANVFPSLVYGSIYGDSLGGPDGSIFPPFSHSQVGSSGFHTIWSSAHFAEIGNLVLYTSPLLPFVIFMVTTKHNRIIGHAKLIFDVAAITGAILYLFLVNPDLGMRWDWDLFASTPVIITLLSSMALFNSLENSKSSLTLTEKIGWGILLSLSTVNLLAIVMYWKPAFTFLP